MNAFAKGFRKASNSAAMSDHNDSATASATASTTDSPIKKVVCSVETVKIDSDQITFSQIEFNQVEASDDDNTNTTPLLDSTMDSTRNNARAKAGRRSSESSKSSGGSRHYDGYLDSTMRYRDESNDHVFSIKEGEQSLAGSQSIVTKQSLAGSENARHSSRKIKYKPSKPRPKINHINMVNDEESLDPVLSIRGGSVTSYNPHKNSHPNKHAKNKTKKIIGTSIRIKEEEYIDPVLSIRGNSNRNTTARSSIATSAYESFHESFHSLIGTSICIDESKRPLNPAYGVRNSQSSLGSTKRGGRNSSPSVTSTSTYFRDEDRTDIGYLKKYRQYFCIGLVLFFLLDIILLAVFFSPARKATKPKIVSNSDKQLEMNEFGISGTKKGRFELLDTVPHDGEAFTQGLEVLSFDKINLMKQQFDESSELLSPPLSSSSHYVLESTGNYGDSSLRVVDAASGEVALKFFINEDYFGKGCTYFYDPPNEREPTEKIRIVQLTWEEGLGFVYELEPPSETSPEWRFAPMGDFKYTSHTTNGKGRGIVYHPLRNQFIVNDGSSYLHFWELTEDLSFMFFTDENYVTSFKFRLVNRVRIKEAIMSEDGSSVEWTNIRNLNDMTWDPYSYGGNTILATIGAENKVVRIWVGEPETDLNDDEILALTESFTTNEVDVGKVTHVYDISELEDLADPAGESKIVMYLNAISFAYETATDSSDEFWMTGSQWPSMHRVRLID